MSQLIGNWSVCIEYNSPNIRESVINSKMQAAWIKKWLHENLILQKPLDSAGSSFCDSHLTLSERHSWTVCSTNIIETTITDAPMVSKGDVSLI